MAFDLSTAKDVTAKKSFDLSTARDVAAKTEVNPVAGTVRAGLQGMTFGASDELGALVAAIPASLQTGDSYWDVYDSMHQGLQDKREQFREDNSGTALTAELIGGIATGGAGGAKALGSAGFRAAGGGGKALRLSGVGAAEGGAYGAAAADQGERLEGGATGAALGAALSPVVAGAANAVGKAGAGALNYSNKKLGEGARSQALRAVRDAADNEGIDGAEAARRMQELGPEGTIADLGDSFRSLARAGMDNQGPMKTQAREMVNARQKGMQGRLSDSIERTTGKSSGRYSQALDDIQTQRSNEAGPMYDAAYEAGVKPTVTLKRLANNDLIKPSIRQGIKWAKSEGKGVDTLRVLHYAKMDLDDQIGKAVRGGEKNLARLLLSRKRELIDEIGAQNPQYIQAMETFAGHSALENALEAGSKLLKTSPDDLAKTVKGMSASELDVFKMGGVKALGDMLDATNLNADAVRKLLGTKKIQDQLKFVVDDPTDLIRTAGAESEMFTTRGMLTGGPNTAERLAAQKSLDITTDPGLGISLATGDPTAVLATLIRTFAKSKPSPEMIGELGDIMLKQGMTRNAVMGIFTDSSFRRVLGGDYDQIVGPYVRGASAPAALAIGQQ